MRSVGGEGEVESVQSALYSRKSKLSDRSGPKRQLEENQYEKDEAHPSQKRKEILQEPRRGRPKHKKGKGVPLEGGFSLI